MELVTLILRDSISHSVGAEPFGSAPFLSFFSQRNYQQVRQAPRPAASAQCAEGGQKRLRFCPRSKACFRPGGAGAWRMGGISPPKHLLDLLHHNKKKGTCQWQVPFAATNLCMNIICSLTAPCPSFQCIPCKRACHQK